MPIYEYRCSACGHEFEEWQKITDEPVKTCPSCGKRRVERLVSATSFQLKGQGWYVTDYGGKRSSESSSGDKGTSGDGSSDTSKKSGSAAGGDD